MQPFQYDLQCSAAKGNCITHAAVMPRNLDAATTMCLITSRRQPEALYAHVNTTWQHECSHFTAICNARFQITLKLRHTNTHNTLKPHQQCGTTTRQNNPSCNRRTHEVAFIAGRSHFTRKNTRFRAQAFPQNQAHATSIQLFSALFRGCLVALLLPQRRLHKHQVQLSSLITSPVLFGVRRRVFIHLFRCKLSPCDLY